MYIINETYFIKELNIPNDNSIDVSGSTTPFESYIDKESRLCLQNALGSVLFAELDSLVVGGTYVPDGSKWDQFIEGETYDFQGVSYTWKGLIFTEGTFKGSVLAYFVYCKWLEFQLSQQTGMGEAKGSAINSQSMNATHRYVNTWNNFIELYQGSERSESFSFVNGVPFLDYFGANGGSYVSLITYLKHKKDDFENASLKMYEAKNTLGI